MKSKKSDFIDTYDSIYQGLKTLKSVLNVMEYCNTPELYPVTINTIAFMLEEITGGLEVNTRKLFHLAVRED